MPHVLHGNVAACITLPSRQMGRNVGATSAASWLQRVSARSSLPIWSFPFMRAHEGV